MTQELEFKGYSGWVFLPINVALYLFGIYWMVTMFMQIDAGQIRGSLVLWHIVARVLVMVVAVWMSVGFKIVQPNESAVLTLFGKYVGTIKENGFIWANPFFLAQKVSLRLRNQNTERLKVNDKSGNPIEIAAVVVWRVSDTFAASFEVDNYVDYVNIQSESAVRHLASIYPYDTWDENEDEEVTLRGSREEIADNLRQELQERLGKAGVIVEEARLTHLAYAPEIASAMLQRQQASAIIAARRQIVDGAVGMVEMALEQLNRSQIVQLDEERLSTMVSNLLVVLCGDRDVQPVLNTGTLYN